MTEPPSIDSDEITDKGYITQRAVLERRAALVAKLYATPPPPRVQRPGFAGISPAAIPPGVDSQPTRR